MRSSVTPASSHHSAATLNQQRDLSGQKASHLLSGWGMRCQWEKLNRERKDSIKIFCNVPKKSLPRYLDISTLHFTHFSHSVMSNSLQPNGLQHTRPPCPSSTPRAYSNSCPSSRWYHPTISFSVVSFSSHLQSFPASGSFPMSQFFASGGQSIGVLASASVLPMNIQYWFPLGLTGLISLQSKGLSRVFSNTTIQKHQFFSAQLSLCSNAWSIHDYKKNHSLIVWTFAGK